MANTGLPVLGDVAVEYRGVLKVRVGDRQLRLPVEHVYELLTAGAIVTFLDGELVDTDRLALPARPLPFPNALTTLAYH